jgi:hypothetical protein
MSGRGWGVVCVSGLAGNNGGGRQKGSRNKLGEAFIADVYAKWQARGGERWIA